MIKVDKEKYVPPKVSLIVTSHNQIKYSRVMYASLRKHTRYPFELVWVDCISTDVTREWLNSSIHEDTVKVFVPKMGIGEAMNIGFSKCSAESEYIGDLDNDLILMEGWLTKLIKHMERDRKIAACQPLWQRNINNLGIVGSVYPFRKRFWRSLPESCKKLGSPLLRKVKKVKMKKKKKLRRENPNRIYSLAKEIKDREGVEIVWWVNGSHTLYRRSALEQVGVWNPVFWMGEDKDIGIRLSNAGWKSAIALNTCVYHFKGKTTDRIDETDSEWQQHRIESKRLLRELYGTRTRQEWKTHYDKDQMINFEDVLSRSEKKSDIYLHLTRLYKLTIDLHVPDKVVVELGVRRGESTIALLAAVNDSGGHFFSIDIEDCVLVRECLKGEPNWTFIKEDDINLIKKWTKPIDHLFIDTSHTYEHTLAELREWGKWVKDHGIISLHDTTAPNYPGVMKAIKKYLGENPTFEFTNYPECFGLGIIKKTLV